LGLAAAIVGSCAGAIWYDVYATRPPCPPGWVQLLDWGPFLAWVCVALAIAALAAAALARVLHGSRVVAGLAGLLLAVASLAGVWAIWSGHQQHGQTYASGCLTFDRLHGPTTADPGESGTEGW